MNQRDFEELYDNYTQTMLFASSNRHKFENVKLEMAEIHRGYGDLMKESPQNLLNSLKGLKIGIEALEDDINTFLYKYGKIGEMLRQIDLIISDYYNIDTEISLYELNGMEKDLFDVKDEYENIKALKLDADRLKRGIDEEIVRLKY
ncbi:MAG: hypothetical protein QMD61_04220 [Methanobacterium sp.]|nr:hypothetical protein [Methanobacterium sp.]